jgi:hypothetical protein
MMARAIDFHWEAPAWPAIWAELTYQLGAPRSPAPPWASILRVPAFASGLTTAAAR